MPQIIPLIDKTAPSITPIQATGTPKKNTEIKEQNWKDMNTIRETGISTKHKIEVKQIGNIANRKHGSIITNTNMQIITNIITPSNISKIIKMIGYDIGANKWNKINIKSEIIIINKNIIICGITQVRRLTFGKQ